MQNKITMCNLPPMRTVRAALAELREADPHTALTERALRRMVLTGELPSVRVGTKYLVNMQLLFDYLSGGTQAGAAEPQSGTIRRVKV